MTDTPLNAYEQRAGITERPAVYIEASRSTYDRVAAVLRAATVTNTFFADFSEFQPVITSAYPYAMASFRADTGYRRDNHAAANWGFIKNSAKIEAAIAYVVYIPGQNAAVMSRLKSLFGSACPGKLAIMIDMESGKGFAGPGNHSTDANALIADIAAWTHNSKKVVAYANHYDFIDNWPGLSSSVKRITASYGTSDPGTWGWQYHGGSNYPHPSGYPVSVAPFGSWVDLNVTHRSIVQVKVDLGITVPTPPPVVPTPAPKPTPPLPVLEDDMFIRFPDCKKNPGAVYILSGGTLTWVNLADFDGLGRPAVHLIPSSATSELYKLPIAHGQIDPRI